MKKAIDETERRRKIQLKYNEENGITPETIHKEIRRGLSDRFKARKTARKTLNLTDDEYDTGEVIAQLEKEMLKAATELDFERAAFLRDQLKELKEVPEIGSTKEN
jgi:excinuclease ABC subunit B